MRRSLCTFAAALCLAVPGGAHTLEGTQTSLSVVLQGDGTEQVTLSILATPAALTRMFAEEAEPHDLARRFLAAIAITTPDGPCTRGPAEPGTPEHDAVRLVAVLTCPTTAVLTLTHDLPMRDFGLDLHMFQVRLDAHQTVMVLPPAGQAVRLPVAQMRAAWAAAD